MRVKLRCPFVATLFLALAWAASGWTDDWPQWRGPHRDGTWREDGVVERFKSEKLELLWRAPLGAGYCGPTVAEKRVFVMDRRTDPQQLERVLCFDARTGTRLWLFSYPCNYAISYTAGPRASVTVDGTRAFALGAMGHLHCLDVGTGTVLWKRDLNRDYRLLAAQRMPEWGIAAAPLVYERLVIVHLGGADGACVVGFDKKSGEEVWRALQDRGQYSAPILLQQAGRDIVACWTGDSVAGLDPQNGTVLWRHPFRPVNMPIGVATPVVDEGRLFVSSFYDGSLLLRLHQDTPRVEPVWRRKGANEQNTDALHCMISTPVLAGDSIYGVDSYGELRCLDAATGDRVWEDQTATRPDRWSNIHIVRNGNHYWMFNEVGQLIISKLARDGFEELSRAQLIDPTPEQLRRRGGVCWSHPAFAYRHVFARNDKEIVCASLARR